MEEIIDVEVLFYDGKRKSPPGGAYRPHFVVQNSSGEYLGVQFVDLEEAPFGSRVPAKAALLFPGVDYSPLIENARFLIMEGANAVGEGILLKRYVKDKARIYVDFNEMVTPDIVLLSKGDCKADSGGNIHRFYEGMSVSIYSDDVGEDGAIDNLIADGTAIQYDLSAGGFPPNWACVKWCCKINEKGIMHESDAKFAAFLKGSCQ
ncbi:MAG: hypothetical protein FWG66_06825 [Spirochaetes bacterium]|nr:hypothetical protein [Spirochaetota bacterium]